LLLPARRGRVPFASLVRLLGARGLTSLLVEGGGTVAAEALRAGVVDRLVLFVAPAILGGDAVAAVGPLGLRQARDAVRVGGLAVAQDRKSTRLNSSHRTISYAVFCLKKKKLDRTGSSEMIDDDLYAAKGALSEFRTAIDPC